MAKPKDGKVFRKVKKADDLEVHVRYRRIDGEEFADIRDYVPSTKFYGRGILIPFDVEGADTVGQIADGLAEVSVS